MGLDISHNCWHGAYSAFMTWRIEIARAFGIPLVLMERFWGYGPYQETIREIVSRHEIKSAFSRSPDGSFVATRENVMGVLSEVSKKDPEFSAMQTVLEDVLPHLPLKWTAFKPDPIHILLSHSDCDGIIESSDCGPIADSLEHILPDLRGDFGGHVGDIREKTQIFIDGLRLAAACGEKVEFS